MCELISILSTLNMMRALASALSGGGRRCIYTPWNRVVETGQVEEVLLGKVVRRQDCLHTAQD